MQLIVLGILACSGFILLQACDPTPSQRLFWLHSLRNLPQKCVQFIYQSNITNSNQSCLATGISALNYSLLSRSMSHLLEVTALPIPYSHCRTIVLQLPAAEDLRELFGNISRRLRPHTMLVILAQSPRTQASSLRQYRSQIHSTALHVLVASANLSGPIHDVVSEVTSDSQQFTVSLQTHLLFRPHSRDPLNDQLPFRVSFFNCHPYAIFVPDPQQPQLLRYDGLEYRFVAATTAHWRLQVMVPPMRPATNASAAAGVWNDDSIELLAAGGCDMAMCAVWLAEQRAARFDLTREFDFNCGTFLVAPPRRLGAAAALTAALSHWVWTGLAAGFALMAAAWWTVAAWMPGPRTAGRDRSAVLVDLVAVLSGHGVARLPPRMPLKWICAAWSVLCLVLGVGYSTGYTALMTRPRFEATVDSLEDFVDGELRWGYFDYFMDLDKSTLPVYQRLLRLAVHEKSMAERRQRVGRDRKYAVYTEIVQDQHLTSISAIAAEVRGMRLIRKCMYNHYTTFGLQKNSPYTEYFSEQIERFRETGIITHWMNEIQMEHFRHQRVFFQRPIPDFRAKPLTLSNLSGSIRLALIGLLLSAVVFAAECIMGQCNIHGDGIKVFV